MTATILVIDDSADDQCLYQRAFKDFNGTFNLVMASSAEAGLSSTAKQKPDLILLDYNLPDMDGLSFMETLAEYTGTPIPIVMLTGEGSAAVAVEAMKHGADDYLVKDTEGRYLRLLPSVVGRVMDAHAQREQTLRLQRETEILLRRKQTLMHNSMDGIHVMDMQGNIMETNDAFCKMLGYTREEAARLNVADWDAQWSAEELRERFKWLIGKSTQFETVHRRKDGSLIHVELSCSGMEIEGRHFLFAASRDITERKRANDELKLHAQILNNISDSVFMFDLDGNFVYLNEAAWKSRGYTRDEMMAMKLSELNTPEFSKLIPPRVKEIMEKGYGFYESAHYCKDGSVMPIEISSRVIDSGGRKLILATIRDITERKKTEAMLMQHKLVVDTSIDGFWMCDMQGNVLEANEAYAKMSGYTVAELARMHISQLEAIELKPEYVQAHIAKVIAQGYDRFETRHRHKNGHEIDIEISVTHMAEPGRLVVFCRDITERKKAERTMQMESETERRRAEVLAQQFGYLLQSSFNEIYMFDARSLKFVLTSEGAEKNLGYSDDELNTLTPLDLKPSYTRESFEVLIAPLRRGEQHLLLFETIHRRKDGSTYPIEVHLQFMAAEQPMFLAIIRDITERKRAEQQARELSAHLQTVREEEKASFAREIHDELGSTLAALKMDASWLAHKLPEKADTLPLQECVKSMVGLLDAAVIATRRIITDLRPTLLDDFGLLAAIKWQADQFHKRTGIECQVACSYSGSGSSEDKLDKTLSINVFRIFQEALTNVARHSGASKVEVEFRCSDDEIVLSIRDNGCGIPQEHAVAATSYGIRGMRERVAQLDGEIKFDCSPGGGFGVTVILPQPSVSK